MGEFEEVSARLPTRISEWHNTDTAETMQVDSPDWLSVSGRLGHGAEVLFPVTTVPFSPSGNRFEIYGREGTVVISGGSANVGLSQLYETHGDEPLAAMETPEVLRWSRRARPRALPGTLPRRVRVSRVACPQGYVSSPTSRTP